MPRDPGVARRLTITLAVIATSGLLFGRGAFAQNLGPYAAAVEQYAAGDATAAIALFSRSTPRLSGDVMTWMRALPDRQVRAAVVMHTELAAARVRDGDVSAATIHIANAQRLLGILTGDVRRRDAAQTFAIRWYAFVTNVWAGQGRYDAAYASVRDGLSAFPRAAELYVARGSVSEMRGSMVDRDPRFAFYTEYRGSLKLLESAAADFQRALDIDPTLAAARLHRGLIHHQLGDKRAAQEFDAALNTATDDGTRYLAHLFRGAVAEVRDDFEAARREYEAAKALGGHQTAYIALARAETALGHGERARAVAMEYAELTEKTEDPWWDYRLGGFTANALEWLRQEARKP